MLAEFDLDRLLEEIPSLAGCRLAPIRKGFSGDKLFVAESGDGTRRLLRLFELQNLGRKREEYEILQDMQRLGVKCPRTLEFGVRSAFGFMLVSYIDGQDAEEELPGLPPPNQFRIGLEAGCELRNLHRLQAPAGLSSWHARKSAKHAGYVEQYKACGVRVKGDGKILDFIERNLPLMEDRPNGFQHDDYHPANLIVADNRLAGVIDFNRFDWGDPLHDFLKTGLFSREVSVPFSIGQIKGYFGENEPDDNFWRLYALYLAMAVISTVVWTLKAAPVSLERMMAKIDRVLEDHQGFERTRPVWYREDFSG